MHVPTIRSRLVIFWTVCACFFYCSLAAHAQSLEYAWKVGQKFSFEFDIEVGGGDETVTYKGVTNYTVEQANAQQLRIVYRGGLSESTKSKQAARNAPLGFGGPFGPRGIPRGPSIPSPFGRSAFAGKTQTTNRIVMSPRGHVLTMDGSSQLPYLLGNVSLIPFESLPKTDRQEWTLDSGVSISEETEGRRFPFGPLGPLAGQNQESVQAASEVTEYKIQSKSKKLVVVQKSYELKTPQTDDREAFDMTGTGTWTFDLIDHVPQTSDMKYTLVVKDGNTTTTIPISLKFTRLSAQRVAELEAVAKQKEEERKMAADDAKAKAEAPLNADEKRQLLQALKSDAPNRITPALIQLSAKTPNDPDPEIASAIRRHLGNRDRALAETAQRALTNWDPNFKRTNELNKAYEGSSPVASSDLEVNSTTPLYIGQIVQIQEHGTFWFAAEVTELLPDGKVKVRYRGWGGNRYATLARRNVQLAPEGVTQPRAPAIAETAQPITRVWSDASGSFKVDAVFIGVADGKVNLRRTDGREIAVPIARLSPSDQEYVKKISAAAKSLDNPFDPPN